MRSHNDRRSDWLDGSFVSRLALPIVGVTILLAAFAGQQATRSATDRIAVWGNAAHQVRVDMLEQQLAAEEFVMDGDYTWRLKYRQVGRQLETHLLTLTGFAGRSADDRHLERALDALRIVQRNQENAITEAISRPHAASEDAWAGNEKTDADLAERAFNTLGEHLEQERRQVESKAMLASLGGLGILVLMGLGVAMVLDARRRRRRLRHRSETLLSDALQVARTEEETETLLALHVEQVVPGGDATLLRINNSENRLAPVTDPGKLAGVLSDAAPSDCLAIRRARTSLNDPDEGELIRCDICGLERSTCVPTMVGGRVTGALVVVHERKPKRDAVDMIEAAVERAAPVIASHRNLSIAERRAATDGLTGIANARAGHEMVVQMVAQAQRSGDALCAVIADLDHFKRVNDQHGHAAGDRTLAASAATIKSCIRKSDFLARLGGEEFLLLLPSTDLPGAIELAEKVRARIAEQNVNGVPSITISLGVACLSDDAFDGEALLRAADRALYEAKRTGRNRVCVPAEPLVQPGT